MHYVFLELRTLILTNMISFVFLQSLAVVNFLEVSVVWMKLSQSIMLNRVETKRKFKRFKKVIRAVEFGYFWVSLGIAISIAKTNRKSYNILRSVFVFITVVGTTSLYIIGRTWLSVIFTLQASKNDANRVIDKYWQFVRNVSTIVIVANTGVIITEVYTMASVRDFDELVEARKDSLHFIC